MSFTVATAVPSSETDCKAIQGLAQASNANGFFEVFSRPVLDKDGNVLEAGRYVGWINILPDGRVEFGHPG